MNRAPECATRCQYATDVGEPGECNPSCQYLGRFVGAVLQGTASEDDIDAFVEAWHTGTAAQTLPEFLGLSEHEYAHWVTHPEALAALLQSKR